MNAESLSTESLWSPRRWRIEILLARRAPRPDVAERLERVAAQVVLAPVGGEVALEPVPPVPPRVAPLAEVGRSVRRARPRAGRVLTKRRGFSGTRKGALRRYRC